MGVPPQSSAALAFTRICGRVGAARKLEQEQPVKQLSVHVTAADLFDRGKT
jgi:hypothetical protein